MNKLKFGLGNAKLNETIATISIPAGYSCPFAKDCKSCANRMTGKITDGKDCKFRCFAVSSECTYPNVRNARWYNFDLLRENSSLNKMVGLIQKSLPSDIAKVRNVSGDFYNETYFAAWLTIALQNPTLIVYGYTKATPYLVKYMDEMPTNFRFVASKGGTHDHLIKEYNLKYAEVVYSIEEAKDKGLEIDHDDSHAYSADNKPFALLLHGMQPVGTDASKALKELRKQGITGYNKKNRK